MGGDRATRLRAMCGHQMLTPAPGLQEYTGIDAGRLELMETRLAADVRREAAKHGQVLVAREQISSSGHAASTITDAYEAVERMPSVCECTQHPCMHMQLRMPASMSWACVGTCP